MAEIVVAILAGVLISFLALLVASDLSGAVSRWLIRQAIAISPQKLRQVMAEDWIADYEEAAKSSPVRALIRAMSFVVYGIWARVSSYLRKNAETAYELNSLLRARFAVAAMGLALPLFLLSIFSRDSNTWATVLVALSTLIGALSTLFAHIERGPSESSKVEDAP